MTPPPNPFQIGDLARLIKANNRENIGRIVTIVSDAHPMYRSLNTSGMFTKPNLHSRQRPTWVYTVEGLGSVNGKPMCCPHEWLQRIDEGDANTMTTWDECVFKPTIKVKS